MDPRPSAPEVIGADTCEAWTRANEDKLCITSSYGSESSATFWTMVNIAIACAVGLVFMMCVAASFKLCRRCIRSKRSGDKLIYDDDADAASVSESPLPPLQMVHMLPAYP